MSQNAASETNPRIAPGWLGDQLVVHAADRVGRLSGRQRREDAARDQLHADEMVRSLGPAPRGRIRSHAVGIEPDAAVVLGLAVRHQRERD